MLLQATSTRPAAVDGPPARDGLVRRRAATLTVPVMAVVAVVVLGLAGTTAPLALAAPGDADSPGPVADAGLFGGQDPTYDGVFRQAQAISGLLAADAEVPTAAVSWLLRQQCSDGSFPSYRAKPDTTCAPGSWDSNASAAAVQALEAVGTGTTTRAAGRAVTWLRTVQNPDGGIGFSADSAATDANSTGLLLSALAAAGVDPRRVRSAAGRTPLDALRGLQLGCAAGASAGALAFQAKGGLSADPLSTSGALLGYAGGAFPLTPARHTAARHTTARHTTAAVLAPDCGADPTGRPAVGPGAAAAYLLREMAADGGLVRYSGTKNVGQTLNAILGLTRLGAADGRVDAAITALRRALPTFVIDEQGGDRPGALGLAAMALAAAGRNPDGFAGIDYPRRIVATLRGGAGTAAPAGAPESARTPESANAPESATLPRTGPRASVPLAVGGGGAVVLGVILLLASRRRTS